MSGFNRANKNNSGEVYHHYFMERNVPGAVEGELAKCGANLFPRGVKYSKFNAYRSHAIGEYLEPVRCIVKSIDRQRHRPLFVVNRIIRGFLLAFSLRGIGP